jgi:two-component system response regulator QseB
MEDGATTLKEGLKIDARRAAVLARRMRVLVVEDDPMIGRAVVNGMRGAGYAVDWVRDGAAAELALGQGAYDLALLDFGLPKKDGLEVLKWLRRSPRDLPVRVITARDTVADRVARHDVGASLLYT